MPIDITGEFQPSDGAHGFNLYDPQDLKAGNIDVELVLVSGGKVRVSGILGEIVPQTGAIVPVHTATEGTLYWDTAANKFYINNNGSTGWTEIGVLATKFKTVTRILYIENPAATDEIPIAHVPDAATMVRVIGVTDVGTVDFNIEKRAQLTPDVAVTGTDQIWTADKQATASGLNQTSFDTPAIGADKWLHYSCSAVASSPQKLWVTLEYTID